MIKLFQGVTKNEGLKNEGKSKLVRTYLSGIQVRITNSEFKLFKRKLSPTARVL